MKALKTFSVFAVSFCVLFSTASAQLDKQATSWADSSGQFRIEATFVRLDGSNVILRKADGKEISVPLTRLSSESQKMAKEASRTAPAKPTAPAMAPAMASTPGAAIAVPANLDAQQFCDFVFGQIKQDKAIVVWDALPASYQKDVQEIVGLALQKIDPSMIQPVMQVRNNVLQILRSKKEFILNNNMVKMAMPDPAVVSKVYDPAVDLIDAYLSKELVEVSKARSSELRTLLESYTSNISKKAAAVEAAIPPESQIAKSYNASNWKNFTYKVESTAADAAVLTMEVPGQPTQIIELTKVEGRWVPADMAKDWDKNMAEAKGELEKLTPEKMLEIKQGMQVPLGMVNGILGTLLAANDQASFDQAVGGILGMLPMMGGGMPMPGGGPLGQ
jgi:SLA1 homology domain 1, SHD1